MEITAYGFPHILSSFFEKDSWKGNMGLKHQGTSGCLGHRTSSTQRSWPWKQWAMAPGGGPGGGNGIPSPVLIPPWAGSVGSFTPNCFKTEPHQLVWLPEPLGEWGLYELCICECPGRSSIHSLNIYCPTLRQALFQVLDLWQQNHTDRIPAPILTNLTVK